MPTPQRVDAIADWSRLSVRTTHRVLALLVKRRKAKRVGSGVAATYTKR